MNRIYKLVWCAVTETWRCVAEIVRACGKASRTGACGKGLAGAALLASTLPVQAGPPAASQLPSAGQIVAGQAQIHTAPNALNIVQSSQRATIDWQSFNIGAAAQVNFLQPSNTSVTLNRVLGADPSQIFGHLRANGHVYLSNPNGVLFAFGARLDVGALVATTMSISTEDFMAGRSSFSRNGSKASIVNQGAITAPSGGYIALLAPEVRNEGVIVAQAGTVALAGGEMITLHFTPDSRLSSISVTSAQVRTLIENRHAVLAEGGQILLSARSVDQLLGGVINTGTLSANSIHERGGVITIEADDIRLAEGGRIEARGASGGGTVRVGGDRLGAGDMHQATTVSLDAGASIDVSATQAGDGGQVVLWSNLHAPAGRTRAQGSIRARGAGGGDGGFVETSGAQVDFTGIRVDTSSAQGGKTGTWLTDPYDLVVDGSAATTITTNLGTTNVTLQTTEAGSSGPGTANAAGSGDITVNAPISWSSGNTLTLIAYRHININAAISAGNTGNVVLVTGDTAGTGVSSSATGDYSFGASTAGGSGNLSFGTTANTATLTIAQGGSGAPSTYTLIYDTSIGANGFTNASVVGSSGNYALANSIIGGTVATSMVSSFGDFSTHAGNFTGLGNAVTGLTITASADNAGLFGTVYGTVRDLGVTGATMNLLNRISNYGLLAGSTSGATIMNSWSTGTVNKSAVGTSSNAGGLIGSMSGGTLSRSYSTADITGRTNNLGGLVGVINGGTVSDSYARGAINNSAGGANTGGLLGLLTGTANLVSNSFATGGVTAHESNTGGLIGEVEHGSLSRPSVVTKSHASGFVSGTDYAGGLIGGTDGYVNITSSYATGNVIGTHPGLGGLIGQTGSTPANITASYASGSVTGTGSNSGQQGGLVGVYRSGTINTSFATGRVIANNNTAASMGGLIGQVDPGGIVYLTDVYAQGSVSGNSYVGGLVGYNNNQSTLNITNAYASGLVSTTGSSPVFIGGVQGNNYSTEVKNVFWDSSSTGTNQASGYGQPLTPVGGGGAVSTAMLQNGVPAGTEGTAVPGFNGTNAFGTTPNGTPWAFTSGFKPYFSWQFPNGMQMISGTGYTNAGAGASAATIRLYANGGLLSGGMVSTNGTGAYTALVNAGSVTTSTKLGATFTLSGAGSISGASYTDAPTMSGADVTGFDLKQGLFLTTTADTTNSALQTSLASAFGSGTYSTLTSTLGSAWWQVNAGGNFTVDTALSHAGSTGLRASGNLAINAGVTATGSTLTLQATGNITENSSGAITATNLVLLGGAVALNSQDINAITSTNNVTTLAASGVSSLSYVDSDALTVGSVGPYQGGITAANINGTTTTTTGLSAAGSLSVYSAADVLTVASNISTTAGAPDATLTLRAGTNLIVNDGLSIGSGGTGKLHTVLWSGWASQASRGGMSVGSTSFNTQGGLFWAGGSASDDASKSIIRSGVTVPAGFAAQFQAGPSRGASFIGTTITTGGGELSLNGRYNRAGPTSDTAGLYLRDATLNAAGGNISLQGRLQSTTASGATLTSGAAVHLSGNTSLQTSGVGTLTALGTDTSTPTGSSHGILFSSNGSETTTLKTVSGAINVNGISSTSAVSDSAGVKFNLATPTAGHVNIVSGSGNITVSGTQTSGSTTSGVEGINFSATGAGSAGAIQIGAEGASAYTGALLIQGSSIAHTGTSTTTGLVSLKGSGSMTVDSPSAFFLKPQTLDNFWDIGTSHSSLTVGKSTNTAQVTLSNALSVAGPISVTAGNLSVAALTTPSNIHLTSTTSGNVTQTGALSAAGLKLAGGNATLTHTSNNVATLAASGMGSLSYIDSNALAIGTLDSTNGIAATGAVSVATLAGDMTLSQNVSTTDTGTSAITLNAGQSAAAGTASGGNIVVSGSPSVSTGANGRATLYSGSATGDTSLATLIGSGSGRFRYNSDEAISNYSTALGSGLHGIYRQQINTGFAVSSANIVYGNSPSLGTTTSLVNGDIATLNVSGAAFSSSGSYRVGSYNVSIANASALTALGYTATGSTSGTLTVTPKALSVAGLSVADRVYDGSAVATVLTGSVSYTGLIAGDNLGLSSSGAFTNKHVGSNKTVTLSNSYGGVDAGNYAITDQITTRASITPKALTVSGITVASRAYNGSATATVNLGGINYAGLIGGDAFSAAVTGRYADKHVGTDKAVTLTSSYSGADVDNYMISSQAGTTGSISAAPITISIGDASKAYDGTATVSGALPVVTSGTVFSGDSLNGGSFAYTSKSVGAGNKTIVVSGVTVNDGNGGANYSTSYANNTRSTITPKGLTITGLTVNDRAYNGTATAGVTTSSANYVGLVSGDQVIVAATGNFADKHVGTGKAVTLTSSYSGADVDNYMISSQAGTTGSISAAPITISIGDASKAYDGTVTVSGALPVVTSGTVFSSDSLSGGSFAYTSKGVGAGNKTIVVSGVTVNDGNGGANYSTSYANNTRSTIMPKALTVSGLSVADREYNGSAAAAVLSGGVQYGGLVAGDAISISTTGSFADKHVGSNRTVTLSNSYGGADAGNYAITDQITTRASITPKALTVSGITVASRAYNGLATATVNLGGINYAGLIGGDAFSAAVTGRYADKHVGTDKAVTLTSSYSGADVDNYMISSQAGTTGSISAAPITISIGDASKAYDGTVTVSGALPVVTSGTVFSGDSLSGGSFAYTNKSVGAGNKTIVVSGVTVNDGNGGANYSTSYANNTHSTITPKGLTITGLTVNDRAYNGTATAGVITSSANYVGLVSGDQVIVAATGNFADKHVGTGKAVTLTSSYSGADVDNYMISSQATTAASITPKTLTLGGLTVAARTYDGSAGATVLTGGTYFTGLVVGDAVSLSSSTGSFADRHVGSDKTVTLTNSYGGADAGNYIITNQPTTTASITPALLKLSTSNVSKTYDGSTTANAGMGAAVILTGGQLFGSDSMSGGSFAYADKNAGVAGKVVNVSGVSINDGNSGANYTLSYAPNTASTITPAALTISGITAANKVYDGKVTASVITSGANYTGRLPGDLVTVSATGNFADRHVGNGKTVALTSNYSGADVGNYTITHQTTTMANIAKAGLLVTANNDSRFVGTSDAASYNGVRFDGFVGGDTSADVNLAGLTVNRPNASVDVAAGSYIGALVPAGASSDSYAISYANGNFTIVPANNVLVKVLNTSVTYSGSPSFTPQTVQYMNGSNVISDLTLSTRSGNSYTYVDGAGGTLNFTLSPQSQTLSNASHLKVGNYAVGDVNPTIGGGNLVGSVHFNGNLAVQTKAVTANASGITKVYDGTKSMTNATLDLAGQISGDRIRVNGSGVFSQKNVGSNLGYAFSGITLADVDASNYHLNGGGTLSGSNGAITPASVTISGITAADKIYDQGIAATIDTSGAVYTGRIGNDDISVAATGLFSSKNASVGKTVTLTSTHGGVDAGNYRFNDQVSATSTITPKALTVSGLAVDTRVYNGTSDATVKLGNASYTGLISGDTVIVSATGSFADKHVGDHKTVTLSSSYSGADVGNYSIINQPTTRGDITPASISITANAVSKTYDGNTSVSSGSALLSAGTLFGSDVIHGGSFAYTNKNVGAGNKHVTVSGVTISDDHGGNNYTVTYVNNTASTITPKAMTVSGILANSKVYDGGRTVTLDTSGPLNFSGLVGNDDVRLLTASGNFADKNVSTAKPVTLTGTYDGLDVTNYTITTQDASANITPAALTLSGIGVADRVYNGSAAATVLTGGVQYAGLIAGDNVSLASASGTFADRNAGTAKTVTLSSLYTGSDLPNYHIVDQVTTTASISPATLNVDGITVQGRSYDGGTAAPLNLAAVQFTGLIAGDDVLLAATGSYADRHAGTAKPVTLSTHYGGADAGNYRITSQNSASGDITPAAIMLSTGPVSKIYDGTTLASADMGATARVTRGQLFGSDSVNGGRFTFANKNAGTDDRVVHVSDIQLSDGNGGGNYMVTYADHTASTIDPKALTVNGVTAGNKRYDGDRQATVSTTGIRYAGLVDGDDVTAAFQGIFDNKNAGTGKTVFLSGVFGGAELGNYQITPQATTAADISALALTIGGISTNLSKVYDGTLLVQVDLSGATYGGLLPGDDIGLQLIGRLNDKHVGVNKPVSIDPIFTGPDAGNYVIGQMPTATTVTITPRPISVSGAAAQDKFHDARTDVQIHGAALTPGLAVTGDDLVLADAGIGSFANPNAGLDKPVNTHMTLTGADAGNYSLQQPIGLKATIRPVSITVRPPPLPLPTPAAPQSPFFGAQNSPDAGELPLALQTPVEPGPNDSAPSNHPDSQVPGIKTLTLLRTLSDARQEGGNFVSVLDFEPMPVPSNAAFDIALPLGTFMHSDPIATLSYEARLSDGRPLPAWLHFDPDELRLSGIAPADEQSFEVEVVARDPNGRDARTKLTIQVGNRR